MRLYIVFAYISLLVPIYGLNIDKIIKDHPDYKSFLSTVALTQNNIETLEAGNFPLDGGISLSTYGQLYEPSFNYSIGVSTDYTLFNNRDDLLNASFNSVELAEVSLLEKYESIKYQLLYLLIQYIHARNFYEITEDSYQSIESYTKKVDSKYNKGDLSKSEMLFADSVLLKNKSSLLDAAYTVSEAKRYFENYSKVKIDENILFEDLGIHAIYDSYKETITSNEMLLDIEKLKLEKELSLKFNIPEVTLSGGIKFPLDLSTSWQLSLSTDISFMDNKIDSLKDEELTLLINSETILLEDYQNSIKNNRDLLISRIKMINEKLDIYRQSLQISESSLEGVLIESNAGTRTVFDVINAQNSISDTKSLILNSQEEIELLQLELFRISGSFHD